MLNEDECEYPTHAGSAIGLDANYVRSGIYDDAAKTLKSTQEGRQNRGPGPRDYLKKMAAQHRSIAQQALCAAKANVETAEVATRQAAEFEAAAERV